MAEADFKPDKNLEAEEFRTITRSRYSTMYRNTLIRIIAAIIIIILLVLAGRWIHHELKNRNKTPSTSGTTQIQQSSVNKPGVSAPSSGSGSNTNSNSAQKPTQTSTQVPNTGPGDVVAIFLAASFAAAALHFAVSTKKA